MIHEHLEHWSDRQTRDTIRHLLTGEGRDRYLKEIGTALDRKD